MSNTLTSPQVASVLERLFAVADKDSERPRPLPPGRASWAEVTAAERADASEDR